MNLRKAAVYLRDKYRSVRIALLGKSPKVRMVQGRYVMKIDPGDWMDRAFYLGHYEAALLHLIRRIVHSGDICVDVGAQKGYVTLYLASLTGPEGRVLAFEPDERAYESLIGNCAANSFHWVTCHRLGLSDGSGTREFAFNREPGSSSFFPNKFALPTVERIGSIETCALDQVLTEAGLENSRIRLIKIDAEGAEPLILRGMSRTIEAMHPILLMEVNYESLRTAGISPEAIEAPLRAAGYTLYELGSERNAMLKIRPTLTPIGTLRHNGRNMIDIAAFPSHSPQLPLLREFVRQQ